MKNGAACINELLSKTTPLIGLKYSFTEKP